MEEKRNKQNSLNNDKRNIAGGPEFPGSGLERREKRRAQVRRRKAGLVFLMLLAICAVVVIFFMPSRKRTDPVQYFAGKMREAASEAMQEEETGDQAAELLPGLEEELSANARAIVLQDRVDRRKALMMDDALYLNYEMVSGELNERFFWDEESRTMLFTTPLELYEIPENSSKYRADGEENSFPQIIVREEEGTLYLSADFVQLFTNLEYVTGEDQCHIKINCRWGSTFVSPVTRDTAMRESAGIKASILEDLSEGEEVTVLSSEKKWALAVSGDGMIGYVSTKALGESVEKEILRDFEEPEYTSVRMDGKVRLVWHAIDNADVNDYLDHDTKSMTGINVISPTWFQISDEEGNISSLASKSYVKKAHHMGLQVWGLLNNFNADVSTYEVMSSASSRRTLEEALMNEASTYDLDGINIDLETITLDSAPGYVQFMRELSILCRKAGIILSVDVPVPMSFNEYYNRKELGTVADYVIMMGYDEHYHGSEAGSVASLAFEENGIMESLEDIPKEKLVSGIPFYTRIWYSWEEADGSQGLASDVVSMYRAAEILAENGIEQTWNEETCQNYACWTDADGVFCQVWMEDETSLAMKAELVNACDLGGFAAWVLGNEKDAVWEMLEETVKG